MLPNGVVDWVTVFQHPEVGFMTNVERADTSEKLHACVHVIVEALFSRDSDEEVRLTFTASIDDLFKHGDSNLISQKVKINLLLSRIMYDREERALKHAEMKGRQELEGEDQRLELEDDDPLLALSDLADGG